MAPLRDLDALGFPDDSDSPWALYPERIVPIITGRGCGWGACSFCSDVTSSMGRTYRSRSAEHVLDEIEFQAEACGAYRFIFVDLKLNSELRVWNGVIDSIAKRVPGVEWAASVHVGSPRDNGLDAARLRAARAAAMVRITTGLESGSQRVLDAMKKGTDVATTSRFLRDAHEADLSVRTTMIVGYPNETADDLLETAAFLNDHSELIERVSLNRLAIIAGTPLRRMVSSDPTRFPEFAGFDPDETMATLDFRIRAAEDPRHRCAVYAVLEAVHGGIRPRPESDSRRIATATACCMDSSHSVCRIARQISVRVARFCCRDL